MIDKINHLYEESGVIHKCEGSRIHKGVYLVWTLCGKDVPANGSFKSNDPVTCKQCKKMEDEPC